MSIKVSEVTYPFSVTQSFHSPVLPSFAKSLRCTAAVFLTPLKTQRGVTMSPSALTVKLTVMWSRLQEAT